MKHRNITGSVMLCYEVWTHVSSILIIVVVTVFHEIIICRKKNNQKKPNKKPQKRKQNHKSSLQIFYFFVSCEMQSSGFQVRNTTMKNDRLIKLIINYLSVHNGKNKKKKNPTNQTKNRREQTISKLTTFLLFWYLEGLLMSLVISVIDFLIKAQFV